MLSWSTEMSNGTDTNIHAGRGSDVTDAKHVPSADTSKCRLSPSSDPNVWGDLRIEVAVEDGLVRHARTSLDKRAVGEGQERNVGVEIPKRLNRR